MARHARVVDQRLRVIRLSTIAIVWLSGLAAGLYSLLSAAAKYGCMSGADGLACRTSGSVVGIVLLVTVLAIVTLVTLTTANRPARPVLVIGGIGLVALVVCLIAACSLLSTA